MPRKRSAISIKAEEMYHSGMRLIDIAKKIGKPPGTVRRWKNTQEWDKGEDESERSETKTNKANDRKKNNIKRTEVVADEVEQVINNPNLTDKQRLFCLHYIKCFNATKAYQKAYGSPYEDAMANGSRMIRNDKIKDEINRLKQARFNKEMLKPEDIFQKYMDIAFSDITDYLEFGREEIPIMTMYGPLVIEDKETGEKIEVKKEINSVRFKESKEIDGTIISEVKQGKDGASIKLADRMKALQWLTDHMDLATEKQMAEIAILKAKTNTEEDLRDINKGILDIAKIIRNPIPNRELPNEEDNNKDGD